MRPSKSSPKPEKAKKEKAIAVQLPQGQFPVILYFNRCGIEHLDHHRLLHFGFATRVAGKEEIIACFACVFERSAIENHKEQWVKYLDQVGLPEPKDAADMDWRCDFGKLSTMPVANIGMLSRTNEDAEMRLYNLSIGDSYTSQTDLKSGPILGQGVALLRCTLSLQRSFLVELYRDLP